MCGAEPLVSMNSAESIEAFYAILDERKHRAMTKSLKHSPKWPAARNDHYCDQKVCRHNAIDLSYLCEPSDSDSDGQLHATPDNEVLSGQCGTTSKRYSDTESCDSGCSCFAAAEYPVGKARYDHVHRETPSTSHNGKDRCSYQEAPEISDSSTLSLRKELDNLRISNAKSCLDLEERFVTLSELYAILRRGYEGLAEKHDGLLNITLELCNEMKVQAKALEELNEWKMRTQKSFAEVQVEGQDPEVLYYGTPRSTSTAEIIPENPEPPPMVAESQAVTFAVNGQDSGVVETLPPPITPGTKPARRVSHPRLVLRLSREPNPPEGPEKSPSALVSDEPTKSKRVRKPSEKRKAAELQAEYTVRKVKKTCTSAPF